MSNWLDFAAIKQQVALSVVLRQYQVPLRRSGRYQYRGICPIHRGQGRDAFHVNLSQNVFHCFSCGAGGSVLDFVAAMERCSLREAARRLQQDCGMAAQTARGISRGSPTVTEKMSTPKPLGFALRDVDSTHPYLATRGLAPSTAAHFGVGYYLGPGLFSGRLVIPIHNAQGELVAYCGRALDGSTPRYRFPPRFAKSQLLFNWHRAAEAGKRVVVVVEGFFACLHLHQAGVRSVVALMGSALSRAQQNLLLERFRHVILMLDGDAAGRRAAAEIASQLRTGCSLQVIELAAEMQPDQLSAEQVRQLLQTSKRQWPVDGLGEIQ
jgi:DNA primase